MVAKLAEEPLPETLNPRVIERDSTLFLLSQASVFKGHSTIGPGATPESLLVTVWGTRYMEAAIFRCHMLCAPNNALNGIRMSVAGRFRPRVDAQAVLNNITRRGRRKDAFSGEYFLVYEDIPNSKQGLRKMIEEGAAFFARIIAETEYKKRIAPSFGSGRLHSLLLPIFVPEWLRSSHSPGSSGYEEVVVPYMREIKPNLPKRMFS